MASSGTVAMPRSFKLLDELEMETKGTNPPGVSVGLKSDDDTSMTEFTGSVVIMTGSGGLVGRFLQLRLTPPADYPLVAPKIKFITKVNLPGVIDSAGNVSASRVAKLAGWSPTSSMAEVLAEIQGLAASAPSSQPGEDATF